jgi:hypothetical protein
MKLSFLLIFAFFTSPAFAVISITGISGGSRSELATTGSTAILYAGLAGSDCAAINPTGSTCNSCDTVAVTPPAACTTQPLCACNSARIYPAGTVTITIKREATMTGEVRMARPDNGNTVITSSNRNNDSVTMSWQDICNGSCDAMTNFTGKVFIDKTPANGTFDSGEEAIDLQVRFVSATAGTYDVWGAATGSEEGIGGTQGFTPYPGDEKIYFRDPETSDGFPTVGTGKIVAVRVFYTDQGLDNLAPTAKSTDLPVASDGSGVDRKIVSGLTNNTTYVFRIALLDEANNVLQFFPGNGGNSTCDSGAAPNFTNCPWAATPEKVLGLLTDDFNCFIASAAYGSSLEPKLDVFREFRFKVLLQHRWGRDFVMWYYKYGSIAAQYISDKPTLRALVRVALWPAYWFSQASLAIGFAKTLILSLVLFITCSISLAFGTRRIFGAH